MKHSLPFQFSTRIGSYDVLISGIGYWLDKYQKDWDNNDCELEDIASFDIEDVSCGIEAYRIDKEIQGDLSYQIDKATLAHMEYVFSEYCEQRHKTMYAEILGTRNAGDDWTDLNQGG